ncbi:LysR family transcriptional regulator [Microvirga pudoricolor]|uniref:LysR family transcriptional regulator n=1 Tax=Microvirga pudoricolor TaxID=2778729 RepID=UPI001951567D|nr:LysR family transcriptional regulator [Microvirga pudoricolor]MBM6593668.1 LysR family transcriptional regulator [Microvirga pudoricolor]
MPFDPDQHHLHRGPLDNEEILSGQFWGELRVFLAVAKSFNRAAEVLNTSQPTVSRQVKRLQDILGAKLFMSTRHGIELTVKGHSLAQALTALDHSLFNLTNGLRTEPQQAEGVVRLSITDGLNTFFLTPAIPSFGQKHPGIQLHLKSLINLVSLRENQTDVMIGFSPPDGTDVTYRHLGRLHFVPVAAKSYIQRHGIPTRENLSQHFFLQSEFYAAKTTQWSEWNHILQAGRVAHLCDNSMAYGMLVKAGLGICLLGSYTILEPDAVPLDLGVKVSLPLYAVALTERLSVRPVAIVFDWLHEIFGPPNPWFRPECRLDPPTTRFDAGIRQLFNL